MDEHQINKLVSNILKSVNLPQDNNMYSFSSNGGHTSDDVNEIISKAFADFGKYFPNQNTFINPSLDKSNYSVTTYVNGKKVSSKPKKSSQPITEPDMNEEEFNDKIYKFLESNTNPQLKFICCQLLMPRCTYKNKQEYIRVITEYLKSRDINQLSEICKTHKIPMDQPKFKQILFMLDKF